MEKEEKEFTVHIASKEQFDEIKKEGKPLLVDFHAAWCGPCKMMAPILEEMAKNYKHIESVHILKVDIDEVADLGREFDIMSVPTFILFNKNGEMSEKMVGMRSASDLEEKLTALVEE